MDPIIDDTLIDYEQLDADSAQAKKDFESERVLETQLKEQQAQTAEASKNNDKPGFFKEAGTAIVGGLAQAGSDIITLPERIADMASGEMQEAGENYKPDWDPFQADKFETTTQWGGLLKNATNFATLFIPVGGIAKGLGIAGKVGTAAAAGSKGAKLLTNPIIRGGIKGAVVDSVMTSSQGENLSNSITKYLPWTETFLGPLATKDTDHPALKTFKNVVEGIGMGAIVDGVFGLIKGSRGVDDVVKRNDSVKAQTIESGKAELEDPGFRGHKNKPVATRTQGNPMSKTDNPMDVSRQLDAVEKEVQVPLEGSTDGPLTSLQATRAGNAVGETPKVMQEVAELVAQDPDFKSNIALLKSGKKKLSELYPQATERVKKLIGGRDWEDVDIDGFLSTRRMDSIDDVAVIKSQDVLTLDLVTGGLAKQIRDLGIAGREVKGMVDVFETDGIVKNLTDKLKTVMIATKRSRYMAGAHLKDFDARDMAAKLKELDESTISQVDAFIDIIKDNPNSDLPEAFLEAMSMSNKIQNISDFDAFMRAKLRGGEFGGKKYEAIVAKEMGAVMVHSILSGPKTPVRAVMGTGIASTNRAFSQALGATLRLPLTGDVATAKSSLASLNAMMQTIPEAFNVFKTRLNAYWSGDVATAATRFSDYSRGEEGWKAYGDWVNTRGNIYDRTAYEISNIGRELNNNKFLTYSTKLMAATDDAFRVISARARSRELAMREVLSQKGKSAKITPADLREADDKFYKNLLDEDGNIDITKDTFLKSVYEEATLTANLEGFSAALEKAFNKSPWIKPFFLFARTGVNGMALTMKNTPILNLALTKQRAIFMGSPDNLISLKKYGINTAEELANEKALMIGRQAIGASVIMMASQAYMSDRLRGNGPQNRQQRQMWKDSGWRSNEMKVGDAWVSTRFLEPWNQVIDIVADIGDAQQTMGEEWVTDRLQAVATIVATSASSKSYLGGLSQLTDLFSGESYQLEKIAGNLMNNTVPMAGLRNEIGKAITPYTRELSSSIADAVRNRNLTTEQLSGEALPIKYDVLNGKPIRDDLFMTRMFNAVSPVSINFDESPGRELLFNSNYDMRLSVMSSPDGVSLKEHPRLRSMFGKAIGDQNLEAQLNVLSRRKDVIASVAKMQDDIELGEHLDPDKAYVHNQLIRQKFLAARRIAWAQIKNTPEAQILIQEAKQKKVENQRSLTETQKVESIILQNK